MLHCRCQPCAVQATAGLFDFCEQPNGAVLHPGDVLRRLRCLHSFHLVSSLTTALFPSVPYGCEQCSCPGCETKQQHSWYILNAVVLQECIDRWLLSSTDYSRPAACPICNQLLAMGSATA